MEMRSKCIILSKHFLGSKQYTASKILASTWLFSSQKFSLWVCQINKFLLRVHQETQICITKRALGVVRNLALDKKKMCRLTRTPRSAKTLSRPSQVNHHQETNNWLLWWKRLGEEKKGAIFSKIWANSLISTSLSSESKKRLIRLDTATWSTF